MFCRKCGKEFNGKFCPNCGEPVAASTDSVQTVTSFPNSADSAEVVQKNPFYSKTWFIVLMMFFCCFPVGLILMWKYKKFNKPVRIVITAFFALCFITGIATSQKQSSTDSDAKATNESYTVSSSTDENKSESSALSKDEVIALDEKIWGYVLPVINSHNQVMKAMDAYSSGQASQLDLYNVAKDFKEFTRQTWSSAPEVTGNGTKEYLDSCMDYIIIEQTMAESLLKYLDSLKTSDLSAFQENIESCNKALNILASNKGVFLSTNGLSDEEIKEISNNLGIEE